VFPNDDIEKAAGENTVLPLRELPCLCLIVKLSKKLPIFSAAIFIA
jgi:hypothetical protein